MTSLMDLGLEQGLNIATSAMRAQSVRMNTIASNMANTGSVGSTEASTYRAQYVTFQEVLDNKENLGGVAVTNLTNSKTPLQKLYDPNNPLAGEDGYVFATDVDHVTSMTDMLDSSNAYKTNIEVMKTIKHMIHQALDAMKI
jgi:flagellar basal-body rod protein FlgC